MSAVPEPIPSTPPPPDAAAPVPPEAPVVVERPCASCGAPLAETQDWCLECGTAQPGRLGGKPGWRAALTVMGATSVLALGAGAAAYAALNSEAQRDADGPVLADATPTVAQPPTTTTPPVTTTPTTPGTTTPTVPAPPSDPADVPEADAPPTTTPSTPSTPAPTPTPSTPGSTATPATPSTPPSNTTTSTTPSTTTPDDEDGDTASDPEPVAVELKDEFLSTYDPYKRGGEAVTDPDNAIDGKSDTAWEAPVGPEGEVRIGLAVSLEEATKLGDLELRADTPGFRVELYASRAKELPPDILDSRWKHIRDKKDVGIRETLRIDGEYKHVMLWITSQPADTKVGIPEIKLFQQED